MREWLLSISPLTNAHKIKAPLFIVQVFLLLFPLFFLCFCFAMHALALPHTRLARPRTLASVGCVQFCFSFVWLASDCLVCVDGFLCVCFAL